VVAGRGSGGAAVLSFSAFDFLPVENSIENLGGLRRWTKMAALRTAVFIFGD
jgi:hypothetical protein